MTTPEIVNRRVSAKCGDVYVHVDWYGEDDRLTITVNGLTIQFPESNADAVAAFKMAVSAL